MKLASALVAGVLALGGCAHTAPTVPTATEVDIPRFMGDWYVIAHIPSFPEREAYNAIESYSMREDGRIQTHFRYRRGCFDAPVRTMEPIGTVRAGTGNAVWGMQFVWPIQAEYVISHLDPDYMLTIVARSKRDYAWIMARTPTISDAAYTDAVQRLRDMGYRIDELRKVPHRWPESDGDGDTGR